MTQFASPYFAAIDLGSNSFHMLVVRLQDSRIEIVDREKEMVQIARGLDDSDNLSEDAQERALACLDRFAERLRGIPAEQIRAVGTKTLRAANNAKGFLRAAEKALGTPIQIISGYEEARLVYAGLSNSVVNEHDQRLVIDIGGGSTEFIIGRGHQAFEMESLSMGCVSFTANFELNPDKLSAKMMHAAYLDACSKLEQIRSQYLRTGWQVAYGTSGTMRAVAELLGTTDGGAVISRVALENFLESAIANKQLNTENITKLRRDVLPAGLAILRAIFEQLQLDKIHVSDATLKEGLIYDNIGRFSNQDARIATVNLLLDKYRIDTEHASQVSKTARHLWKQISDAPVLSGLSRTKILDWAAKLHEAGLSISHSSHHQHGYYILRHSDLAGFSRHEQYIMANLVRSHRKKIVVSRFEDMDKAALAAFYPLLFCLRIAVLVHRRRENQPILPALTVKKNTFLIKISEEWLEAHPLTRSGLEQETQQLKKIGINLEF
ncbi:exopolyphosphatase/guanosine-5'-triphosphate,3'-diphosphate pyrophosphatase [Alteromonadaceae bacterium 2753L.S.0a.02]|nr:exopolyphosphatase/guanosine-5'-triphosphate,3'-diphosphate pyrophosphatase [Alteromonadaceae bacterium 2753L.S.0a.02]